ncbi:MAG: hypothetical protein JJU36_01700 [Phycisphaeraceae bacterium]|nr:hypothetical protein [Phycisphaeraceae bacterium]
MENPGTGFRFGSFNIPGANLGGPLNRLGKGRSGWVWRISLMLAGVLVLVPMLILVLGLVLSGIVFLITFTVLGWIDGMVRWIGGERPKDRDSNDDRRQVIIESSHRVITDEEDTGRP